MKKWQKTLINFAFKVLEKEVCERIKTHVELHNFVVKILSLLREVVDKLTDKDPNNQAQLEEVWNQFKDDLFGSSLGVIAAMIRTKFKNPVIGNYLADLILALQLADEANELPENIVSRTNV